MSAIPGATLSGQGPGVTGMYIYTPDAVCIVCEPVWPSGKA